MAIAPWRYREDGLIERLRIETGRDRGSQIHDIVAQNVTMNNVHITQKLVWR